MDKEKILSLLQTAEQTIATARALIGEIEGRASSSAASAKPTASEVPEDPNATIVEGVFDGEKMLGPDGRAYPVPHNYASKSKLVPGDLLKLTILSDGRFIYKNIGPIERRNVIGVLTYEDGTYRVLAGDKSYKVLTASVTFFKAQPGDQMTIIIPAHHDSSWAAVETVLSQPVELDNIVPPAKPTDEKPAAAEAADAEK